MLLIVEKEIRGRIVYEIHRYAKVRNKYMKNYDKTIQLSCLMYLNVNNFYGWGMCQKLPVNGFKWIKKFSKFDEEFKKNMMWKVIKDIFLK